MSNKRAPLAYLHRLAGCPRSRAIVPGASLCAGMPVCCLCQFVATDWEEPACPARRGRALRIRKGDFSLILTDITQRPCKPARDVPCRAAGSDLYFTDCPGHSSNMQAARLPDRARQIDGTMRASFLMG